MKSVAIFLCLYLTAAASGERLFGWIDLDNQIIAQPSGSDIEAAGLDITSANAHLIPIPPGDNTASVAPFTFPLANSSEQITAGHLGWTSTIPFEGGLSIGAGYDLTAARDEGLNPCDDLVIAYGDGPKPPVFPVGGLPPSPPPPRLVFCTIPGDVDFDGTVTFDDFLTFSSKYGMSRAVWPDGDFDWDREVGFSDFLLLSENFEQSLPATTSVPEPTGISLLLIAIALSARSTARFNREK